MKARLELQTVCEVSLSADSPDKRFKRYGLGFRDSCHVDLLAARGGHGSAPAEPKAGRRNADSAGICFGGPGHFLRKSPKWPRSEAVGSGPGAITRQPGES